MTPEKALRIVVIGASAAGLRAAARARRRLPDAKVLVIDEGSHISYGACGMPYYVSGDIHNADRLRETGWGVVRDPDFFRKAKGIEVVIDTSVERIDRGARKVVCRSTASGETPEYTYDKLVLATGASPVLLDGVPRDSRRVTTFKTLQDAIDLRRLLEKGEIKSVAIVGGGFIGCELAESFGALWGVDVILIEAAPNILTGILDSDMAAHVEKYMRSEDIELHTNSPLEEIVESEGKVVVKAAGGTFEVSHAVIAVGVKPSTGLAAGCGLELGQRGGIVVDERMTTSDPDVFAAGDCVQVRHLISGRALQMPLGSLANRQGRVVGSNLAGGDERFGPVVGSAAVKIFDMNVASTGLTETTARDAGFEVECAWGAFNDKADYYPGSENVSLKLVYEKRSGRLLGLQGISKGEVVKRVDVFAALLKHQGHVEDLLDMEFAYAPPFAPAVDPLFSLGAIARNAMFEGVEPVSPSASLDDRLAIDVRQPYEAEEKPLGGDSVPNIALEELREKCGEIPMDRPLITVCAKGVRSSECVRILREKGFSDVKYLGGGMAMRTSE